MSVTGKFIRVRSEESQETGLGGLSISEQGSHGIVVINRTPFRNSPDSDLDGREKGKVLDGKFKEDSGWILGSRVFVRNRKSWQKSLAKAWHRNVNVCSRTECGAVAQCGVESGTWY